MLVFAARHKVPDGSRLCAAEPSTIASGRRRLRALSVAEASAAALACSGSREPPVSTRSPSGGPGCALCDGVANGFSTLDAAHEQIAVTHQRRQGSQDEQLPEGYLRPTRRSPRPGKCAGSFPLCLTGVFHPQVVARGWKLVSTRRTPEEILRFRPISSSFLLLFFYFFLRNYKACKSVELCGLGTPFRA